MPQDNVPRPETGLVAVIGMGAVLPDANNVSEFWNNLQSGRYSVREVPKERWDPELYWSPDPSVPDKTYSKIGAFVTGFRFDPMKFRIPPKVVKSMDDSQLWALECALQALADAGYDKKEFDRGRCAVILGNAMGGETRNAGSIRIAYPLMRKAVLESPGFMRLPAEEQKRILTEAEGKFKAQFPEITEDTMPGELSNVIAGRIANVLNLSGKNFTTDAACASSLAAIDAACKSLLYRECDMVLTGGVDRSMDVGSYVKFSKIGALSPDGSFPFDARANGFVMGEGGAMFLLKRLEDAERDGDRILAVIRGVGSSSDGKGKGITAPNLEGQLKCVTRAFADGEIQPTDVDYVECHGTSTKVGDVVEIEGLSKIFQGAAHQSIPIGSVKSNIGHLKSAAGAAGLAKVVLALRNKTLPPAASFERPNPSIRFEQTPFYVNTKATPWPEPRGARARRAGVSSFGFGGTNFHVIAEEYAPGKNTPKARHLPVVVASRGAAPAAVEPPVASGVSQVLLRPSATAGEPLAPQARMELLVVGGADAAAVEQRAREIGARLAQLNPGEVPAFLAQNNERALLEPVRLALVLEEPREAKAKIEEGLEALRDPKKRALLANKGIHVGEGRATGKIAFLFPGQGSQYADMVRDLATRYVSVRRTLEEADQVMVPLVGKPLTDFLFTDAQRGRSRDVVEEDLKRTEITQPAVLAADAALFRLLADHGVRPDVVAGHSLGEYGALVAAGVLTFADSITAVSARGREMAAVKVPDLGKMASVSADPATVEAKLKAVQGYVIPANKNCKVQTVIAGASPAVDEAVRMFASQGIQAQPIPVSAAFHSAIVAPAKKPLRAVLERLDVREPKIPILSNVHADYYPRGPRAREHALELLEQQVAAPVEWQRQIERMHDDGVRLFIEVGPKATLTTFCKNILEGRPYAAIATNHPKKGGFFHFFDTLALLASVGYPVRFPRPSDAAVYMPAYLQVAASQPAPAAITVPMAVPTTSVTSVAFPNLEAKAEEFIRAKQEELRRALLSELKSNAAAPAAPTSAAQAELEELKRRVEALGLNLEPVVVSGVSVGTPGTGKRLFDDTNFDRIAAGQNAIEALTAEEQQRQVEMNIVRLVKSETGNHRFESIRDVAEVIKLAAKKGEFDLVKEYGVNAELDDALDVTSRMAIAAGLEALRDAGIPLVRGYVKTTTGKFLPGEWALPEPLQHETGVIFASAFPGYANLVDHLSRYLAYQYGTRPFEEIAQLYQELVAAVRDPEQRHRLETWYARHERELKAPGRPDVFEFSRRFLVQVLSLGHAQLAQLIRAKGPNTQVNAACSSTTQAVAIAEDWIRTGRCKRVLIVGADDVTHPAMLEHWASGFLAAGAATTKGDVREAALPFDRRRHGMIIGSGAVGLVVEAESLVKERGMEPLVEIVGTSIANSAYHITRLDTEHVATLMDDLLARVEKRLGVTRGQIADRMLFMSHETYTPARGGSAAAEIAALTKTFGNHVSKVLVANTKGFTGHPMGASIEDVIAIRSVQTGNVPPIANLREPDPSLGDIRLSKGGHYDLEYGLRLAAGFGSQIAMFVFKLRSRAMDRVVQRTTYMSWVSRVSGARNPELEVVHRQLRVKSQMPALVEAKPSAVPASVVPPAAPAPPPVPAVARPVLRREEVLARVTDVVAEKTGYPKEMLDPNLELEADLGIDTVKQAELFGVVRETYGIARDDTLQLKDINTLSKIAEYIVSRNGSPAPTSPVAAPVEPIRAPPTTAPVPAPASDAPRMDRAAILERVVGVVAEKTGYPRDMLDPNLELEADLGIDTVKQAEIFGLVREELRLPRDDALQLKDVNTLNKIADYLHARQAGGAPASAAAPAPQPALAPPVPPPAPQHALAPPVPAPASQSMAPVVGPVDRAAALQRVRALVAEKTGYPLEMLEPELDLEADLGIDTVKQAELFGVVRETYGLPRRDDLQLKDVNTLAKIADYVVANAPGAAVAAAPALVVGPAVAPPAATPPSLLPAAAASHGKADVLEAVRRLVADRTGYPLELLEPELDLEADLGIDTVKQAEFFGTIRESYGIPRRDDLQLKDINTLSKIADYILAHAGTGAASAAAEPQAVVNGSAPAAAPRTTKRYVVRPVRAPPGAQDRSLRGKSLILLAPRAHREALEAEIAAHGGQTVPMESLPKRWEDAPGLVAALTAAGPVHGLVYVPEADPVGTAYHWQHADRVKGLFYLTKALLAGQQPIEVLGIVTHMGGDFAQSAPAAFNPLDGSLVGFAKAFARERPEAVVKAVDVLAATPPPATARLVVEELLRGDGLVEIGTRDGRLTLRLLEQETVEEEPGVHLTEKDVLVVSGGATGITAEIVQRLAPTRAGFVLLGRTPLPAEAAQWAAFTKAQWDAKRAEVQEDLKRRGERVTPVAIERALSALRKAAEVHTTLEALRRAGARAVYYDVDVTDRSAVQAVVARARAEVGDPTGIVHAAGVEESKLIQDKSPESFDRVYDVKVRGARNLLEATASDPVRFFLAFTSIAGRFGNAGQSDYSAANDALAKLCAALRAERGATFPATAIDWSAWDEKGMATRGSIMTVLREAGVAAIPLAEGVQRCLDELAHGCRDPEVVVAGALGRFAPETSFARPDEVWTPPAPTPAPARGPEAETGGQLLVVEAPAETGNLIQGEVRSDGRVATLAWRLDPAVEPFLNEHRVDGVPYLPGVMGIEAFAEVAASLAPGRRFAGAHDVEFRLPVKCLRDKPIEVTVVASVALETPEQVHVGCRLQSVFTNARGEAFGPPRLHFTATLVFERSDPVRRTLPEPTGAIERIVEKKEIYRHFFHGPSFRVLNNVGFETDGRTTIGIWADPRAPPLAGRPARFLTAPLLRELAYQTAGSHELFRGQQLALPKAEARLTFYHDASPEAAVRAVARFKELRDNVAHFDVAVATTDGDLLFEIEDFQLIRLRPLETTNGAAPVEAPVHYRARWGHDLPVPLGEVAAVTIDGREVDAAGVTQSESLTSGERQDQERFRNEKRAREFFLGRLAAKESIALLLGRPTKEARGIEIRRLESGEPQPRGSGLEDVLVSITHTDSTAVAVAARRSAQVQQIGIDAERIEPKPTAFETEAFTETERRLIDRLVAEGRDRAETVVRFWAAKEAVLKALGKGFALDVQQVEARALADDERVEIALRAGAREALDALGGGRLECRTWVRDGLAYALAWTHA